MIPYRGVRSSAGRYRKVYMRIWGDEKFRSLSAPPPNAQTLFLYLITGPHAWPIPGLFNVGEAALAESLGWTVKAFREAFREVFAKGMAKADWAAKVVYLPKAIHHNRPESPNVAKAWRKAFDDIPECDLKREAFRDFKDFLEGLPKAFTEAFGEDLPEGKAESKAISNKQKEEDGAPSKTKPVPISDEAFLAALKAQYRGVDVDVELRKMDAWLLLHPRRKKTRPFIVAWLNRCDLPLAPENGNGYGTASSGPTLNGAWFNDCEQGKRGGCVKEEFWEAFAKEWRGASREVDQCPAHRGSL